MKKLLIICGPTATGKTGIAAEIADELNGELVSADSRQVYIGMDIGTGKDKKLVRNTQVWMYDVVSPDQSYSVSAYRKGALDAIADIHHRGKLPIVVGGTGFYINAILTPQDTFDIKPDKKLRKKLAILTLEQLQRSLHSYDSETYNKLNNSDKNNPRRLIRKIEIACSDKPDSKNEQIATEFDCKTIGLTAPRLMLNIRIDRRVDERVNAGIIEEISELLKKGYTWETSSMSGLGYKQWRGYFESKQNKEQCIFQWKSDEHRYAIRQMTWFRRNPRIEWFDIEESHVKEKVTASVFSWYTNCGK